MTSPRDPRAIAFARYLRVTAQDFSEVAEETDMVSVAEAGLVLLDAADIVQDWTIVTRELRDLDRAGRFGATPEGRLRFLPTAAVHDEVRRGLFAELQRPQDLLACIVEVATRTDPAGEERLA